MVFHKQEFIESRRYFCECGCRQGGHDAHHVFIHNIKTKGKTKYPQLNDPRNLVLVNHDEHISRKFDTMEWRLRFWEKQCKRYGEENMMEWVNSLPDKIKPRMDFLFQLSEKRLPHDHTEL